MIKILGFVSQMGKFTCIIFSMNLYLYTGKDIYRMESSLNLLLEKNHIDTDYTVHIDGSNPKTFRMDRVLMECDTMTLFEEGKKAVVLVNPFFLKAETKTSSDKKSREYRERENRMNLLQSYLKQPNPSTVLIFECHGYNADTRKSEYKLLDKYGCETVQFEVMDEESFRKYAMRELKKSGFVLENDAMEELLARTGTDTLLFQNAMTKFDLYGEKNLTCKDIRHLVSLNPEINIFNLTSGFMKKDLSMALSTMNEMLNAGYDYPALISLLSKRLRMIYNVRSLYESGMDNEQIAFRMKQKKGYVWYVLKDSSEYSAKKLLALLNELAELDQKIKLGTVQPRFGFEQFLIRNGKR